MHMLTCDNLLEQNKDKEKKGKLPTDMIEENRYLAAVTTGDVWICYPWEAKYVLRPSYSPWARLAWLTLCNNRDIDEHDRCALEHPVI